jgi:hypothetical protein
MAFSVEMKCSVRWCLRQNRSKKTGAGVLPRAG